MVLPIGRRFDAVGQDDALDAIQAKVSLIAGLLGNVDDSATMSLSKVGKDGVSDR